MRQIDRVHPDLRDQIEGPLVRTTQISRETLEADRALSRQRLADRPEFGSTKPEKRTINTAEGPLDLYLFGEPQAGMPKPCLLWFHGGGYVMGLGEDRWNGPLFCERSDCIVVSVDYRLAPEHPFPAAIHDGMAALRWVHDEAEALGIDPARIAVGGASAGGGLAAALALWGRDHGGPALCYQLLLYPMLDHTHDTPSGRIPDHPVFCRADSLACWEMYLGPTFDPALSGYASPAHAQNLADLPPAHICVGEVDLFLDECADYHRRLSAAGVASSYQQVPGMFHGGEVAGYGTEVGRGMVDVYVAALREGLR